MSKIIMIIGAALLGAISSHSVSASVNILGNYPPANDYFSSTISAGVGQKGVLFTMPELSYTVDAVTLQLGGYNSSFDTAAIGFYADSEGMPDALVGMLQAPSSDSDTIADFTFTPTSTLTLSANTTYWLMIDTTAGGFDWMAAHIESTPGGEATYLGHYFSNTNGATYGGSSTLNTFQILGTEVAAVPEPAEYAALLGLGTLGFVAWRRRRNA
ncbi:MAG: choice-of-anchor R domain-containing protein [Verrucomicrobiota bacterium JB022]|nr:choice-of-anchor R domain-containing protein [Verrucomicrobiota bacterium JB022]